MIYLLQGAIASSLVATVLLPQAMAATNVGVEELLKLPEAEQHRFLAKVLNDRLRLTRNIHYKSTFAVSSYAFENGGKGAFVGAGSVEDSYEYWGLGDQYKMAIKKPSRSERVQGTLFIVAGFDRGQGEYKGYSKFPDAKHHFGRIDSKVDEAVFGDRYIYWMDGEHSRLGEFLWRYFLDHVENVQLAPGDASNEVIVTVPWTPHFANEPLGMRTVVLDSSRGYLPQEGYGKWSRTRPSNKEMWREEKFTVEAARRFGDVWMPTKLREEIHASSIPDRVAVYATTADVEVGTVKPSDLSVELPAGTEVVNALDGTSYTIGETGDRKDEEELYTGPIPSEESPERVDYWLYLNIIIVVVIAGWLLVVKLRR